jgi:hypothetical protein
MHGGSYSGKKRRNKGIIKALGKKSASLGDCTN